MPSLRSWASATCRRLLAAARSNGQLWVVSGALAFRYSGSGFEEVVGMNEAALWQIPEARTEYEGGLAIYDGRDGFVTVPVETGCPKSMARADPDDAWCFGGSGQLFHSTGERDDWERVAADAFGEVLGANDFGRVPPALWAGGARLAWGDAPEHVLRVCEADRGSAVTAPLEVLERYDGESWGELARGFFWRTKTSPRRSRWSPACSRPQRSRPARTRCSA